MRIFVSAGEASGDHLAASLIRAMRAAAPSASFWGMGGHESESCGMEVAWSSEALQLMGLGEVLGLKVEPARSPLWAVSNVKAGAGVAARSTLQAFALTSGAPRVSVAKPTRSVF